jgi:hypothetical protein
MGRGISESIFEKFFQQLFARLAFVSEPLLPFFLTRFLNKQLSQWKYEGLIDDYKVEAKRVQKFHYRIDVDLDLTLDQTRDILNKSVDRVSKRVRRWVYG